MQQLRRKTQYLLQNPWAALPILDDLVGTRNAKCLIPLVAYSAAKAPQGEQVASLASGVLALGTTPAIAKAGVWMAARAGLATGGLYGFAIGALFSMKPTEWLRDSAFRAIRTLQTADRSQRRLELGGRYTDTMNNYLMRRQAMADMAGTHQNARVWLGQEAAFLQ